MMPSVASKENQSIEGSVRGGFSHIKSPLRGSSEAEKSTPKKRKVLGELQQNLDFRLDCVPHGAGSRKASFAVSTPPSRKSPFEDIDSPAVTKHVTFNLPRTTLRHFVDLPEEGDGPSPTKRLTRRLDSASLCDENDSYQAEMATGGGESEAYCPVELPNSANLLADRHAKARAKVDSEQRSPSSSENTADKNAQRSSFLSSTDEFSCYASRSSVYNSAINTLYKGIRDPRNPETLASIGDQLSMHKLLPSSAFSSKSSGKPIPIVALSNLSVFKGKMSYWREKYKTCDE